MKRKVLLLSLALMMCAVGIVSAATKWGTFEGYTIVRLIINGDVVTPKDTPPVILKDRTMVPISMLEDAGLDVTWDPETYSVNVESNVPTDDNDEINKIRDMFVIADLYKQLGELGNSLCSISNSLSLAFNGLNRLNDRKALDNSYTYLNSYIDMYNKKIEYLDTLNNNLSPKGYNLTQAYNILNDYYKSIDYYKAAQAYLEGYALDKNSNDDFDSYMEASSNGFDSADNGRTSAIPEYASISKKIIN